MERALFTYKPEISQKALLLAIGILWLVCSVLLFNRGLEYIFENSHNILFHLFIGTVCGSFFFLILMFKTSKKYAIRIIHFTSEKQFSWLLMGLKTYFFIAFLIAIIIALKKTDIIPPIHLSITYICVGFSLFLSSFIFFYFIFISKKIYSDNAFSNKQS